MRSGMIVPGLMLVISIGVVAPAAAQTCVPPPYGMVSWWQRDGSAVDVIGGRDGVLEGGASYTTGLVGQAFHFDAATGIVRADATGLPAGNAPRTVELWTMPTYNPAHPGRLAFGYGAESQCRCFLVFAAQVNRSKREVLDTRSCYTLDSGSSIEDGQWHHIAVTYDGVAATIYLDGVRVASSSVSTNTGTSGGACIGGRCSDSEHLAGSVDRRPVLRWL